MRLDKALSLAGYTRSEAKALIARGRVCVAGETVRDSGKNVQICDVTLDGRPIDAQEEIYRMLHKPAGVVTATEDRRLPTVFSLRWSSASWASSSVRAVRARAWLGSE